MEQLGDNNNNNIQVLKDPFKEAKITEISLRYSKVMFEKYFSWVARVYFQNGDTSGTQKFEVIESEKDNAFEIITKQIQAFVDNLS